MADRSIRVDWVALDGLIAQADELHDQLSPREIERAAAFREDRDRRRYVARRGWLRQRLAPLVGSPPREIPIVADRWGKPHVPGSAVAFNLSHAQGVALLVTGQDGQVGCDIEWEDPSFPVLACAARFFSATEAAWLTSLLPSRRTPAFYFAWTQKEAFVKAVGEGLSIPLDSFDVQVDPDLPARLLRGCGDWSVASFEPLPGFRAAIVARGQWRLVPQVR